MSKKDRTYCHSYYAVFTPDPTLKVRLSQKDYNRSVGRCLEAATQIVAVSYVFMRFLGKKLKLTIHIYLGFKN